MTWIFFAIAAPALYSASSFVDKFLIEKRVKNPILLTVLGGIITFLATAAVFLFHGTGSLSISQISILLVAGMAAELALIPYYRALSFDDTSRVLPLFQIIPIFVAILSYVLLGETLTSFGIIAFLLIMSGGFMLSLKKISSATFRLRRSFWWAMAASALYAFPSVLFKLVVVHADFWTTLAYECLGGAIGAFILFLIFFKKSEQEAITLSGNTWIIIVGNEILYFIGQLSGFYAVTLGPVALVAAFGSTGPLFTLLYGIILSLWLPQIIKEDLAESTLRIKTIAIILILAGGILISVSR
jgi:uncharacterized membrane protein